MKKNKISVLVTTMDDNIGRVIEDLVPQLKNCEISISHQITNKKKYNYEFSKNVVYHSMRKKGLSKNRNNALKFAKSDICVICDDDFSYVNNFEKTILKAYEDYPDSDIITFQALDEIGDFHGKIYNKVFRHNWRTILSVNSSMITYKKSSLDKNNVKFDENFGLGTKWCVGEENILLSDCLKKKLNILQYNKPIVIHSKESSGLDYRDELIKSRPVVFYRMFGFLGLGLALIYFPIFHYKLYRKKYSVFKFIKLSFKGILEY
jgi:glycosyltransferase involved in cell wall biosynthesis